MQKISIPPVLHEILYAFLYAIVFGLLGPIWIPVFIVMPLIMLVAAIALGMIGIGIIIFFLTGGALFFLPIAWFFNGINIVKYIQKIFFQNRQNFKYPLLPVILTFPLLAVFPAGVFIYGYIYEAIYIFITSIAIAVYTLRKPSDPDKKPDGNLL
jgi:hypothetical protein